MRVTTEIRGIINKFHLITGNGSLCCPGSLYILLNDISTRGCQVMTETNLGKAGDLGTKMEFIPPTKLW